MNSDKMIEPEKIHIVSIKTLKGNIDCAADSNSEAIEGHTFKFQMEMGVNVKDKIIGFQFGVNIEGVGKSDEELNISGSYTHEILFMVENLNDFLVENPTGVTIDALLGSTLVGIAYSTTRGIIFNRTQGTSLGTVTLPVIDPSLLMPRSE